MAGECRCGHFRSCKKWTSDWMELCSDELLKSLCWRLRKAAVVVESLKSLHLQVARRLCHHDQVLYKGLRCLYEVVLPTEYCGSFLRWIVAVTRYCHNFPICKARICPQVYGCRPNRMVCVNMGETGLRADVFHHSWQLVYSQAADFHTHGRQFFLGYWNRASHSGFNFDRNSSRAVRPSVLLLVLFIMLATCLPRLPFSQQENFSFSPLP